MASIELKGGDRLLKRLAEIGKEFGSKKSVRMGFLEGATYPDGTSVAQVAAINNFGAPAAGIPARPFFTNMIRQKSPEWGLILVRLIKQSDGDVDKALAKMGLFMESQLADSIVEMNEPPNSMVTNLLKQRFPTGTYEFDDVLKAWDDVAAGVTASPGKPLVWSGHLLHSIGSEVVD